MLGCGKDGVPPPGALRAESHWGAAIVTLQQPPSRSHKALLSGQGPGGHKASAQRAQCGTEIVEVFGLHPGTGPVGGRGPGPEEADLDAGSQGS